MLLFIKVSSDSLNPSFVDFKTSHVIVYRWLNHDDGSGLLFQNISCYCLSFHSIHISKTLCHFKTSHVIVYPWKMAWKTAGNDISKHLMLLFICNVAYVAGEGMGFQNISCYCLSTSLFVFLCTTHISKHLMLLFITEYA